MSLSTLVGVTNSLQIFTLAYSYINFQFGEFDLFLFDCLKDFIFHDIYPGIRVILGDFATGFNAVMVRKRSQTLD